jgi:hypothetical protein
VLAELSVSDKQIRRICKSIGDERIDERDAAVAEYQAMPLSERKSAPEGVAVPEVAVVGVDGGRLQIFERVPKGKPPIVESEEEIQDDEVVPEPTKQKMRWREDKIGVLLTMKSVVQGTDPCPEIPASFVDRQWIAKLAKELSKRSATAKEADPPTPPVPKEAAKSEENAEWKPPEVQSKQLVATRRSWAHFGPMVAALAYAHGFFLATRRAFLGDGAENNWTLWRTYFSSFVPILDFIHALSYVFHSAMAGRPLEEGWQVYERWIGWVWLGEIEKVIAELAVRQAELGTPPADAKETSPGKIVSRALRYLQSNMDRMRYAEYRREGLPIVSSYVESAVNEYNHRVKGTEKFWRELGAEEMLQLRGDHQSDADVMGEFWRRRQANATGQAPYRKAA